MLDQSSDGRRSLGRIAYAWPARERAEAAPRHFDPIIRAAHWLTLLLLIAAFGLAFAHEHAGSRAAATALLQLHRSFGLTLWPVTLFRLAWRQISRFPPWPIDMPDWMRAAARGSEYLLYALLLLLPLLGLLQTNAHGDRVDLFLLGELPPLIGRDRALARQLLAAHEAVALLLLAVIGVHAAAALFHHFIRRDDTLNAMLPHALRRKR
jgi:cytochrome b561